MTKRIILFEIDDEVAEHFDALVADWKKDPVWLARRFFEEEVLAHTSGGRDVPFFRRSLYRDPDIYFTEVELQEHDAEHERSRDPITEAARQAEMEELFTKMNKNREGRT